MCLKGVCPRHGFLGAQLVCLVVLGMSFGNIGYGASQGARGKLSEATQRKQTENSGQQSGSEKPDKTKKLVTNTFLQTPLSQALSDMAAQTRTTIITGQTVQGVVSCELEQVPLDRALDIILAGTGYEVEKKNGYYLVYSPDPESKAFTQVSEMSQIRLNYIDAQTAVSLLGSHWEPYVQAPKEGHVLCVTAPDPVRKKIEAAIKKLDKAPRHVMLDARVVILEQRNLLDLGVEWEWPNIQAGAFSTDERHGSNAASPEWPWGLQIGYTPGQEFTDSLMLTLNLLSQNNEARIVANPQVMAQDGKKAEIDVSTEEYFRIVTGGYYDYERSELEKIDYGTKLTITPRITDDGEITMDMQVEVSDVVAKGEDNLPVINRRTTTNTVRIEDGGTAAVAGLKDRTSEKVRRKVPYLGSIPVMGRLFTKDENSEESRQVAVFVTARLVADGKQPTGTAQPAAPPIQPVSEKVFKEQLRDVLEVLSPPRSPYTSS